MNKICGRIAISKHKIYSEQEISLALKSKRAEIDPDCELYDSDEWRRDVIKTLSGGGVECMRCGGWFCY